MKKILVTGANGQLGNEMRLLAEEHRNFEYFFTDVAELDICDEQAVMEFVSAHQIDVIVNCAAYTAVDKAEDNVELCDKLNHVAPGYLAKAAQSRNGWLVQVSTDYVFDGTAHIPYKEEDTPCPNSVYGSTKLAGEQEALKQCPNTMVIRTAWLYSTFGNNFVKTMIRLGRRKKRWELSSTRLVRRLMHAIWLRPFLWHWRKVSCRVFIISVTKACAPGMILPKLSIVWQVSLLVMCLRFTQRIILRKLVVRTILCSTRPS